MDRTVVISLVTETYAEDAYGVLKRTTTKRDVYADVRSVGAREWFEGGRNGLNPEYQIRMFGPDYNGEDIVILDGIQYTVYRTYQTRNDIIELYVQKKQGNADAYPG